MIAKILLLIALFIFFLTSTASAAFSIVLDLNSIDFANMKPGQIRGDLPSQGITVTCTSDQGNPWYLRICVKEPLTHMGNPSSIIPNENFLWYGLETTGTGTLVTAEQDFTEERIAYTAPAGEGASGVDIKLRFKLKIPQTVQSGDYATEITLTLIE